MARKLKSDKILFLATLLLVFASMVMVYSASQSRAIQNPDEQYGLLVKQAMWVALALAIIILVMRFDYHHFRQPAVIWTMLGIAALGLVAVLFGPKLNGARRWLAVGHLGIQPSEFAKLAMVVFVAALLERRMERINEVTYSLTPIAIALAVIVGLIYLEPDYGSAVVIVLLVAIMVFAAGLAWRYLAGVALTLGPAAVLAVVLSEYRMRRVLAFLDPWKDPQGGSFQLIQSLIAVGTGGVLGKGLSNSFQKLGFLPEAHNDFIYAVISEELGLVGATAIVLCFAVLAWRGLRVAAHAPDAFGSLLATGVTAMVAVQAFMNVSVVLGLVPTKGIALPLVSAGGSSLLVNALAIGIVLNISQHASTD